VDREQRRQFVRDHRTCVFGYPRQGHGPAMTVVYYVMEGDDLLISTMAARGKARAIGRNGKVSLCVLDEKWPLTYVQVYGDAVLERDEKQAADVLRRVIGVMAGEEVPPERHEQIAEMAREEERVVIRVTPYATFATPPRHVHKMSDIDDLTHWTSSSQPW
jgi:PPOX class probable F420-dependent enzyme